MIALFVLIELLCSSNRRLSPNRAYGIPVFEGSPIHYNIAAEEATVSCSSTFLCKVEHHFYFNFASRPVVALCRKPVGPRGR